MKPIVLIFLLFASSCFGRTLVQSCSNGATSAPAAAGTITISATCASNFTVGNEVIIAAGLHIQGISGLDNFFSPAFSDGAGNSYTVQVGFAGVGHIGASEGMGSSTITIGGTNTATFSFQYSLTSSGSATFDRAIIVLEYSGVSNPFIPASGTNSVLILGVPGVNPFALASNVVQNRATATLTYGGGGGGGGPGTDCALSQMDLFALNNDNIFSSAINFGGSQTPPTASGVTTSFTQRVSVVGGSSTLYFWDSTPLPVAYQGSYVSIL